MNNKTGEEYLPNSRGEHLKQSWAQCIQVTAKDAEPTWSVYHVMDGANVLWTCRSKECTGEVFLKRVSDVWKIPEPIRLVNVSVDGQDRIVKLVGCEFSSEDLVLDNCFGHNMVKVGLYVDNGERCKRMCTRWVDK